MELFLFFAVHGIFAGLVYLFFMFIRHLANNTLILTILLDFACGIIIGLILLRAVILASIGKVQVQLVIYFLLGFTSTLITFENFVASASNYVYNKIRKAIICLNKNKRRNFDGCTKTTTKN